MPNARIDDVVGYHVSLTRIRSWVRASVWSFYFFHFCNFNSNESFSILSSLRLYIFGQAGETILLDFSEESQIAYSVGKRLAPLSLSLFIER